MTSLLMRRFCLSCFCLVCILSFYIVNPSGIKAADTIKIGLIDVASGPFEHIGRGGVFAVQFLVDEINAKGGLLGKKIEVIKEDSEAKPDVGVRKAKKLILEDKVDIIGVGIGSNVGIALNKIATEYKKITINYFGAADALTGAEFSRYGFRVCNMMYSYMDGFGKFLAARGLKKFYIICQDYAAGRDMGRVFKERIKSFIPDADIVGEDYHPLNNKDFAPYVTKIINSKAEAVFTMNFGPDLVLLFKQSRSLGLKVPFVNMFTYEPILLNEVKEDGIGNIWSYPYSMRVNTPENQAMIAKYHEKHKDDKDFLNWWPYGLVGMAICGWTTVFDAVQKAGSVDPEKIIETYEGLSTKTPVGIWTMRKCDHQVVVPMFAGTVEGGWNPWYNGSIRPDVKFPCEGPNIMTVPSSAIPATPDYNPRCK